MQVKSKAIKAGKAWIARFKARFGRWGLRKRPRQKDFAWLDLNDLVIDDLSMDFREPRRNPALTDGETKSRGTCS